jgi:hypothetical protein
MFLAVRRLFQGPSYEVKSLAGIYWLEKASQLPRDLPRLCCTPDFETSDVATQCGAEVVNYQIGWN